MSRSSQTLPLALLSVLAIIAIASAAGPAIVTGTSEIRVERSSQYFKDAYNRTMVYHGQNVVAKLPPFHPQLDVFNASFSFVEQDAQLLREWGFNSIRLYMAWEGFEPQRHQYDYAYLAKLKQIIELCKKYDISVLLDAHQDLYSRFFCGEGMPAWTIMDNTNNTFPFFLPKKSISRDDEGQPLIADCLKRPFFEYYFTKDVGQQGENLFVNYNGLADDFAAMWGAVATYFGGFPELTNLLGYEIINEPFGVSIYNHPKEWIHGDIQNNDYLLPFYKKVNEQIRKGDQARLVFYEPVVWAVFGGGFSDNLGFPEKEVLSYHVYCGLNSPTTGEPISRLLCDVLDSSFIAVKERGIQDMKVGGFLTEFGAVNNTTMSAAELDYVLNKVDKHVRSWTHWQYKGFGDYTTASQSDVEGLFDQYGNIQEIKLKHLSRPYAEAVCSSDNEIVSEFNSKLVTFELKYTDNNCANGKTTEIYLSEQFWFTNRKVVLAENVKELVQIPNRPAGYYSVIPLIHGKKVHLILRNQA